MPMKQIQPVTITVSAASATGVLTTTDTGPVFPGALAWVNKSGAAARVRVIAILSATTFTVRRFKDDNENTSPPNYGLSDMSAFDGGAKFSQDGQLVPYDPAFSKVSVA